MKNKNTVVCKYKDANTYAMVCEEAESELQPAEQTVTEQQPAAVEPVVSETAPVEEEIAVPIVGDVETAKTEAEAESVEPLGESESWYPDTVDYNKVVNYEYGTSTQFVASLTNPEEGITASDIVLIAIIALSCLAIVGSATILAGRAIENRARRKDFVKK